MKITYKVLPAFIVLLAGISISIWIQKKQNDAKKIEKIHQIEQIIAKNTQAIHQKISSSFSTIELLRYLFEDQNSISREEFKTFTEPILRVNPGIYAVSWVPQITNETRAQYEVNNHKENSQFPKTITQRSHKNKLIPADERSVYFPVTYIEPLSENKQALGYDIYSNEIRKMTIDRAISSGKVQITPRIHLVQDTIGYGFLCLIPVPFSEIQKRNSPKPQNIKGLISAVFKTEQFIKSALANYENSNISLVVYDVSNNSREFIYGDKTLLNKNYLVQIQEIQVANRDWELNFIINPEFNKISNTYTSILAGFLITLILILLLLNPLIKEQQNLNLINKLRSEQKVRIKTEQSLIESGDYNRALFQETTIGLLLNSMDGKFVDANPALCHMTGRTKEEILNLSYWDLTPEKYNEQEQVQLKNMADTGHYGPYEKEYFHKDGHLVPVRLQGKTIIRNGIKYILSSIEDVTERKQAEDVILKVKNRLDYALNSIDTGVWELDLVNGNSWRSFKHDKIFGYTTPLEDWTYQMFLGHVIPEDKKMVDERFQTAIATKINWDFECRINREDGVLRWIHGKGNHGLNDKNEASKMFGIVQDITDRKLAEEQLKTSEEKYRALFEYAPDGILIADTKSNYLGANKNICNMLGYSKEEILGLHATDIVVPAEYKSIDPALEEIKNKNGYQREWVFKRKNGTTFKADVQVTTMPDGNLMAIVRDITEQEKSKVALRESEIKYRSLFENMTAGFVLFEVVFNEKGETIDLLIVKANERFASTTGSTLKDTIGKYLTKVLPGIENDAADWIGKYARVALTGEPTRFEQGSELLGYYYAVTAYPSGSKQCAVIFEDITERKRVEEALKKSEQEFRILAESMPQIVWATRADGGNIYFNQQWMDYTGMTLEESYGNGWNKPFHPDDQQRALDAWGEAVKNNSIYSIESRLRRFDGKYRWWLVRGVPFIDKNGVIQKWFGTCTDIDDMKQTGKALKESEERFILINDSSCDSIYSYDLKGRFTSANRNLCKVLNRNQDQIIGRTHAELGFNETLCKEWDELHQQVYATNNTVISETFATEEDGEIHYYEVILNPLRDSLGNIVGIGGSTKDVTDRKQAEEKIRKFNEELELLVAERTSELESANKELEEINDLFVGREFRIIELKDELEKLKRNFKQDKDSPN